MISLISKGYYGDTEEMLRLGQSGALRLPGRRDEWRFEMAQTEQEVTSDIRGYMDKHGGAYSGWYVGITEDARRRLFTDHNVDEKADLWIYRTASSFEVARRVERYFVDTLGTEGGPGGGDIDAKVVYGYRKRSHTNP